MNDERAKVAKASAILDDYLAPIKAGDQSDDRLLEAIELLEEVIDDAE